MKKQKKDPSAPLQERWKELEANHRLLDRAYRLARVGTWEYDMLSGELYWSTVTKEVHGFDESYEPDVESTIALFKEGPDRERFAEVVKEAIEDEQPFDVELKIISGQGDERWIRATGEPEYKEGVCVRFYGISQNVTDRKQAEEDLQLNEQRFKALVQDGSDLIAILDEEANYLYVSPTSETVLGIAPEEFIGKNALDFIHPDDRERIVAVLSDLPVKKRVEIDPFRFLNAEGKWRWIETTITNLMKDPAVGGLVANSRDITEKKLQQEKILESLKEKETLLAEIHHRVKNNLAVVTGFLQIQALNEKNPDVIARLNDGVTRIQTMSIIHEQLYQTDSFSQLNFTENIRLLARNILKSYQSETTVNLEFHCHPVHLSITQAIPSSLIVNEAVTNCFKHAFAGRSEGNIVISLSEPERDQLVLEVRDNGTGLPEHVEPAGSSSLGMTLIRVLSLQLDATYNYESSDNGTAFSLRFQKKTI